MAKRNWLGTVLGAVASYYTGYTGFLGLGAQADSSANQQKEAERMASDNRAFQERLSSTAYQRQAQDMRAAGMNPIAGFGAGGASSPGGSVSPALDVIGPAINSALTVSRTKAEIDNLEETNDKIRSDTVLNEALTKKAREDTQVSANSAKNLAVNNKLLDAQVPRAVNLSETEKGAFGKIMSYIDRIGDAFGSFFGKIGTGGGYSGRNR